MSRRLITTKTTGSGAGGGYTHPSCICQTILCSPCIKQEYPKDGKANFKPTSQWVTIANCDSWQGSGNITCWMYNFCDFKEVKFSIAHAACTSFNCCCMFYLDTSGNPLCCCEYLHIPRCLTAPAKCCFIGQGFICSCQTLGITGKLYPWPWFKCGDTCGIPAIGWELVSGWEMGGYNNFMCAFKGVNTSCLPGVGKLNWCNFGGIGICHPTTTLSNFQGGNFWFQGMLCDGGDV